MSVEELFLPEAEDTKTGEQTAPGRSPNWQTVIQSPVWRLVLEPWLKVLYFEALQAMAPAGAPGTPGADVATLETYQYHRGRVDAFRELLHTPEGELAIQRLAQAEKEKDDAARRAAAAKRRRRQR